MDTYGHKQEGGRTVNSLILGSLSAEERKQKAHYDRIADCYEVHSADKSSEKYRTKFIMEAMTANIDLAGAEVLDAMCGSGYTVKHLLAKGARVTGLDISAEVIDKFRAKWPQCEAIQASILDPQLADETFDCVLVVGGLHHLQPYVGPAIDQIHRVLKQGGYLCFVEPHVGSVPDMVRRLWYKVDHMFEKNEQAIDVDVMMSENAHRFDFIKTKYCGNVAYLLVYNSLIFRVPLWLKHFYAPPLLVLESWLDRLIGKRLSCQVICQWRKRAISSPASV
jgi:SAM-dependent methyltransferase